MKKILFFLMATSAILTSSAQSFKALEEVWRHPTSEYRMKTWWFFGYERTADEGITADVEALRDAGFGGVVYYDQNHAKDARAQGAEEAFSPEWWRHLRLAASEARRVGLSFELNISDGSPGVCSLCHTTYPVSRSQPALHRRTRICHQPQQSPMAADETRMASGSPLGGHAPSGKSRTRRINIPR